MTTFKGFADDESLKGNPYYLRGCQMGALLATMSPEDRAEVESVINRMEITATAINRALSARTAERVPTADTINRHRNRRCRCAE